MLNFLKNHLKPHAGATDYIEMVAHTDKKTLSILSRPGLRGGVSALLSADLKSKTSLNEKQNQIRGCKGRNDDTSISSDDHGSNFLAQLEILPP